MVALFVLQNRPVWPGCMGKNIFVKRRIGEIPMFKTIGLSNYEKLPFSKQNGHPVQVADVHFQ
jgi:hypothetical protein